MRTKIKEKKKNVLAIFSLYRLAVALDQEECLRKVCNEGKMREIAVKS